MSDKTQTWFPGRDYPDREEWLKKRATPKKSLERGVMIHTHRPETGKYKPLVLGLNKIKRRVEKEALVSSNPKKGCRQELVRYRHEYYTQREESKS